MNRSINEAFEKGIKDDATPEYVIKQVCTDHKSSLNIKKCRYSLPNIVVQVPKDRKSSTWKKLKTQPPKMKMSKLSKRALYRHRANDSTLLQVPNRLKDPQATILQKNQSMTHPLQQIQSKQQMKQSKNHIFLYVLNIFPYSLGQSQLRAEDPTF